jgi:hypothetical protein
MTLFESSVLDIGAGVSGFMNSKIKYADEPIRPGKPVEDFLPPPDELALKEETVKVTISLSRESVDFFKSQAKKFGTPYQKMIRRLLDAYARAHKS